MLIFPLNIRNIKENYDLHALDIAYVHLTLDVKEVPVFFHYEKSFLAKV